MDIMEESVKHIEACLEEDFKEACETYLLGGCEWLREGDYIYPVMSVDEVFAKQAGLQPNIVLLLPPLKYEINKL